MAFVFMELAPDALRPGTCSRQGSLKVNENKETDMKIQRIFAIATVLTLVAAIGAPYAAAQVEDLRVQVPFEFYAAGKLCPPGTYLLTKENPTTLRLRDPRGKVVFLSTDRETTGMNDQSWVLFHQYGQRSFLAGAYWSGASISLRVPESRAEKEVARIASQRTPVTIAAR